MLKVYSLSYRIILILITGLYVFATFAVGVAGHVTNNDKDFYVLVFAFITFFSLVFQQKFLGTTQLFLHIHLQF